MAGQSGALAAALFEQSRTVCDWLGNLPINDFGRPTVLPGWDVRTLNGHLIFAHQGLARAIGQPTRERPLLVADYVRGYRPAVDSIMESTHTSTGDHSGPELVGELSRAIDDLALLLGGDLPPVVSAPRGPIRTSDLIATRIVEIVVHADDLSRSLPYRQAIELHRAALSRCTRTLAEILAGQQPGRSVEVRVPPYAAVQCSISTGGGDPGPTHSRGTPPNVVETDPLTFLRLATGRLTWDEATSAGAVRASGFRANLAAALPVLS